MTNDADTIAAELAEAERDLGQWERLTSAKTRVAQLRRDYERARAAQDKADEILAKAAADARFAGLSAITVTGKGEGVLNIIYNITWTELRWDMYSGLSLPRRTHRTGFNGVPDNVLAFLIEKHPEQIPAEIMALAPGNPAEAMSRYFVSKRRGYVVGPASA